MLNLTSGVDWYSLSDLTFLSTTKFPAGDEFLPSSTLTYIEDGAAVIVGGIRRSAHVLRRDRGVQNLVHGGTSVQLFLEYSDHGNRKRRYRTICGTRYP